MRQMHDFAKPMHDFAKLFSIYIPNFAISFTIDIAKWQFLTTHHRVMAVNARNLLPSFVLLLRRTWHTEKCRSKLLPRSSILPAGSSTAASRPSLASQPSNCRFK